MARLLACASGCGGSANEGPQNRHVVSITPSVWGKHFSTLGICLKFSCIAQAIPRIKERPRILAMRHLTCSLAHAWPPPKTLSREDYTVAEEQLNTEYAFASSAAARRPAWFGDRNISEANGLRCGSGPLPVRDTECGDTRGRIHAGLASSKALSAHEHACIVHVLAPRSFNLYDFWLRFS
jgi:hypothetical protein